MTTEELLKDPNARFLIEWAYRVGRYDEAYNLAVNKDGGLYVGVTGTPWQKYRDEIINSNYESADDIINSISYLMFPISVFTK